MAATRAEAALHQVLLHAVEDAPERVARVLIATCEAGQELGTQPGVVAAITQLNRFLSERDAALRRHLVMLHAANGLGEHPRASGEGVDARHHIDETLADVIVRLHDGLHRVGSHDNAVRADHAEDARQEAEPLGPVVRVDEDDLGEPVRHCQRIDIHMTEPQHVRTRLLDGDLPATTGQLHLRTSEHKPLVDDRPHERLRGDERVTVADATVRSGGEDRRDGATEEILRDALGLNQCGFHSVYCMLGFSRRVLGDAREANYPARISTRSDEAQDLRFDQAGTVVLEDPPGILPRVELGLPLHDLRLEELLGDLTDDPVATRRDRVTNDPQAREGLRDVDRRPVVLHENVLAIGELLHPLGLARGMIHRDGLLHAILRTVLVVAQALPNGELDHDGVQGLGGLLTEELAVCGHGLVESDEIVELREAGDLLLDTGLNDRAV